MPSLTVTVGASGMDGTWVGVAMRDGQVDASLQMKVGELERALDACGKDRDRLRQALDRYRRLVENLNDVVYALDEEAVVTYVSPNIHVLGGYDPSEIVGKRFTEFVHPEDLPNRITKFKKILSGEMEASEYRLLTKTGDVRWVRTSARPVLEQGRVTGVQGVLVDITARKRAEEELERYKDHLEALVEQRTASLKGMNDRLLGEIEERKRVEETLRRSEERYRRLAENLRDMIWRTDAEGRILYVNRAVEHICGIPQEEAVGLSVDAYFTPESIRKTIGWIQEAQNARPRRDAYHGEVECLHKDGRRIPCEVNVTILRDESGRITGFEGVTRDITKRKRAEEALKRLNEDLERKVAERTGELEEALKKLRRLDRMKDEFLSLVSHELRTPLTSIRSFAEILLRYDEEPDTRREFLEIIHSESERLTRLINDVLDFSRIEAGRMSWHESSFSLGEVVREVANLQQALLEEKGLELCLDIPSELPLVFLDRDRLQQVITNLLNNAIKFSTRGGKVRIRVRGVTPGMQGGTPEWLQVCVEDQGVGIREEDQEVIFERFHQVASDTLTDRPHGTGLGLPICKEIINHYGGHIWVESKPGKGSRFFFTVPLNGAALGRGDPGLYPGEGRRSSPDPPCRGSDRS